MTKFHKVLEPKENILWEGKPNALPYILDKTIPYLFLATLWIFLVYIFVLGEHPKEYDSSRLFFLIFPHILMGLALALGPLIYSYFSQKNIRYLATDKRILIQSGILGEDFESIEYDEIAQTKVDLGLRDLLSGRSGSIFLHGKNRNGLVTPSGFFYALHHVENPYEVFKLIEKVSRDFKTEMKYPNKAPRSDSRGIPAYGGSEIPPKLRPTVGAKGDKLRPKINKGYKIK